MKLPKRSQQALGSTLSIILVIVAWVFFAPTNIGGRAAYVILAGNSMQPRFALGDLVVTHRQARYQIGDALAYQHPTIGYVFHRVVAQDETGNFILKGDHNDWEDAYHPDKDEIVGKLWLHIPKLGKTLEVLRSPFAFSMLSLVLILLFFIFLLPPKEKNKHKKGHSAMSNTPMKIEEKLLLLALIVAASLVLGIISFRRPLLNEIEEPIPYQQEASFRYTADVPAGVYDSSQVVSGEPIFRKLNGAFKVELDYFFLSMYPAGIHGSYQLSAIISDATGWKRTIELLPQTNFEGNLFTVSETLSLDQVQALIDHFETETGVARGQYALTILADIRIAGTLAGLDMEDRFQPALQFNINDLEVVLDEAPSNAGEALNPSASGALTRKSFETNLLSIFGLPVPVISARWMALLIGVPALIFLGILLIKFYHTTQKSEWERARLWYGSAFIESRDAQLLTAPQQVEIASVDDLASLAEQEQRPIFHFAEGQTHHLFIQTPQRNYHYAITDAAPARAIIEAERKERKPRQWNFPRLGQDTQAKEAYEFALRGWANAVEKTLYQQGEADRMAEMAYALAERLNIRGAELENIRMAAYLHKIGLMDIPEEILEKKNQLTLKEKEILSQHPVYASKYLHGTALLEPIAKAIYHQHERWDGSGQPDGLHGEEIPLGSRIIAIVSTWNGLSQARPYRKAWEDEEICKYCQSEAGKQFDPKIVEVFLALQQEKCPNIRTVQVMEASHDNAQD